ncbi:MAG: FtsW/RodA/SpoVE family cell cycle protein [Phaeodactylibacter sp.]|nr:FtsW/RodA/SpoVE family cell cycle protein [Phaeodactylibacter sp.]MCB9294796.1 FtsW/RodA/SpoVE family cell cycle protein [Lewinellaceae bacterium]
MSLGTRIYAELRGDRSIWAIMAVLSVFSILVVYSSTGTLAYREMGGNTEALLVKHFIIVVGGLLLAYLAHLLHYMRYSKAAPYLLLVSLPLLLYTIAFGADINDARRWISVPFVGITFQTSDFAKLALILYVARAISSKQDYIKDFNSAFLPIIVPVLIICGLIAPADLSTAILLFFTCVSMMFVGRVALQYIILLLLLGIVVFAMLVLLGEFFPEIVRSETWVNRVRDFVDKPDGGYQVQQAKIAMANGEWFGLGPGNSIQRNYLPSPYSDFIYAIVVEEYGIFVGILLILLYVLLFFRATRLVTKSPKAFGAMLAIGLSISLVLQAFINIAVSVHLVPVTGVTLPMISMGGTSILFTCISFGMILSVSKYIESVSE